MSTEKSLAQVAYEARWRYSGIASWVQEREDCKKNWGAAAQAVLNASDCRTMRSLLLRIHSARVAMSQDAVIAALDDVDAFFREENTN